MYKDHYKVSPGESNVYQAIIMSPWVFKLVYGAICDTVSICGYRKSWWMVIMGLVQFVTLYKASDNGNESVQFMTFLLATSSLSSAFMDVIVDALMVMQAKRDPDNGTQNLVSF